jgi:hypothetical protein
MGTGFFPDARWHGLAQGLRTPGEGERMVAAITAEAFAGIVRAASPRATDEAIAEYWKGLCDDRRKAAALALYRSGDFGELERYDGCLRRWTSPRSCCGAPTTVRAGLGRPPLRARAAAGRARRARRGRALPHGGRPRARRPGAGRVPVRLDRPAP